jgi:hypothetical protein
MIHAKTMTKGARRPSLPHKAAWCEPYIDGFCYSIDCQDGMKGIRVTGGIAGIDEFHPLFPCVKG